MERTILITGASRGIGRATALQLAGRETRLILVARDEARLRQVALEVGARGGQARVACIDLTNDDSVRRGVEACLEHGPVDVLVNNAGLCHQSTFLQASEVERAEEWEVNYHGALRMIRALLPSMMVRRHGRILNVSSLLGQSAAPTTANYSATKAALEAFSQGLRGELAACGVSVEVFVAPHTETELGQRTTMDGVVSLPVEYVAGRLAQAIDRRSDRSYGSPVYRVFSWLVRWFPRFMERQMVRAARSALARADDAPLLPRPAHTERPMLNP